MSEPPKKKKSSSRIQFQGEENQTPRDKDSRKEKSDAANKRKSRRATRRGTVVTPPSRSLGTGFIAQQQLQGQTPNIRLFLQQISKQLLIEGVKVPLHQVDNLIIQNNTRLNQNKDTHAKLLCSDSELTLLQSIQQQISAFLEEQSQLRSVIKIQAAIRFWKVKKTLNKPLIDSIRGRNQVFIELLQTERKYINSLTTLINTFVQPVRQSDIIAPNECAFIFSNIESIREEHIKLCSQLENARVNWPLLKNIGEIFLHIKSLLNAYDCYVSNFKTGMNEVRRLTEENPRFKQFCENASFDDMDLTTGLSLPVNRVSQYEFFLSNLADQLPEGTPEREDCTKAFAVLAQSSIVVQRSLVESTATAKILALQRKLRSAGGPINYIAPGRILMKEFKFKKHLVALFNDHIIVAKAQGKEIFSRNKSDQQLYQIQKSVELRKTSLGAVDQKKFDLVLEGETIKVSVGTVPEEKNEFIQKYNSAIEEINRVKVFGVSLGDTVIREERPSGIPFIIEILVDYIRKNCATQPGIFRVAGSKSEMQELQQVFDKGGRGVQNINLGDKSHFSVCDLLKLYFRMLPEPMLGYSLYVPIVDVMRPSDMELPVRISKLREELLRWTPPFALKVLRYLLAFLRDIAKEGESNKMHSANLAIVFGPTLLWPKQNTLESAMDIPYVNHAVQLFIDHYDEIIC